LELQNTNAWNVNDNRIKQLYHHLDEPTNSFFTEFLYKQVHKLMPILTKQQQLGLN